MPRRIAACLVVVALAPLAGCCRQTSHRESESRKWAREVRCGSSNGHGAREWLRSARGCRDGRVSQSQLWWRRVRAGECE